MFNSEATQQTFENWYTMSQAAKLLDVKGIGRTKLMEFLRWAEVLNKNNEPYQKYVDVDYFKYVVKQREWHWGQDLVPLVSDKGMAFIAKLLEKRKADFLKWREEQAAPFQWSRII